MEQTKQYYSQSWVVLSAVLLAYFLYLFQRSDISTVTPTMMAAYDWNGSTLGWINSAMIWSYAVMQIPFGYVSERWLGARLTVTIGTLLVALGAVLFGVFLPNVGLSVATRILIGVGSAAILVPANSMFARWFSPSKRGLQTAILFTGGQVAAILASVLMPLLVGESSSTLGLPPVQFAFLIVGAPMVLAVPIVFRFTRNRPEDVGLPPLAGNAPERIEEPHSEGESIGAVLRHSSSPYLLTLLYAGFIGGSGISVWVGLYLASVYKLGLGLEAFIFTMVTIVPWLPGQPLAGVLGDRIGHRKVVVYALLGAFLDMGLLTSLIALYGTIPLQYAIVLLAVFWACTSGLVNAWPLTTELFSSRAAGTVAGMMNTGGNLAGAIVAVVAGYFIVPGSTFVFVFATGAVVTLLGLTAALLLPSKRLQNQPR